MDQLVEMGFTPEQASDALARSNNDTNKAIEFLFGESDTPGVEDPPLESLAGSHDIESVSLVDSDQFIENVAYQSTPRKPNEPTTILPKQAGHLYNYVLPLLLSCTQFASFTGSISKGPIEWDSEWWRSSEDTLSVQIQRAIAYLSSPDTHRLYIIGNFAKSFEGIDEIEELVERFYMFCEKMAPGELFVLRVTRNNGDDSDDEADPEGLPIYVIPVDGDLRRESVVSTLGALFWNSDGSEISLEKVAPVVTIAYHGDFEYGTPAQQLKLDEYLNLDIFHAKNTAIISEMKEEQLALSAKRAKISQELMSYNSFEGKKIKHVLNNVCTWFENVDKEAHEDLVKLTDNIKVQLAKLMDELDDLGKKYARLDITEKNVRDRMEAKNMLTPESSEKRHMLTSVILSDTQYFYRSKEYGSSSEQWIFFSGKYGPDKQVTTFEVDKMDFESMSTYVMEETFKGYENGLILVYADENTFNGTEEIPSVFKQFIAKDNELGQEVSDSEDEHEESQEDVRSQQQSLGSQEQSLGSQQQSFGSQQQSLGSQQQSFGSQEQNVGNVEKVHTVEE